MNYFLVFTLVICGSLRQASGHGRMMDPVARSSAWRLGFNLPKNYDDNALFCGGFQRQMSNGGKCGICGDPWNEKNRTHEAGGDYAKGIIVQTYKMGQVINTTAEITANHGGYMEYRICPNNDSRKEATQECLDQHVLLRADGKGTRVVIDTGRTGYWIMDYKLPAGMTCSQCVVQWKYHTAKSWGVDPVTGQGCVGCGPQEEFYGCADVAIQGDGPVIPPEPVPAVTISTRVPRPVTQRTAAQTLARVQSTTPREFIGVKTTCKGINNWAGDPQMDQWCTDSCSKGNCPSYGCDCTGANPIIHQAETTTTTTTTTTTPTTTTTTPRPTTTSPTTRETTPMLHQELTSRTQCKAINLWAGNEYLDRWCADSCAHGNCPPDSCQCTVVQQVVTEPTTILLFPETGTPPQLSASTGKVCKAIALWKGIDVFDRWCTEECNNHDNCPPETCVCTEQAQLTTTTTTTQVTSSAAARSGMTCLSNGIVGGDYWNEWCQSNCDRGYCQSDYCLCL